MLKFLASKLTEIKPVMT